MLKNRFQRIQFENNNKNNAVLTTATNCNLLLDKIEMKTSILLDIQ